MPAPHVTLGLDLSCWRAAGMRPTDSLWRWEERGAGDWGREGGRKERQNEEET